MRNKQTKRKSASTLGTVNMKEATETETARLTGENIRLTVEISRLSAENNRLAEKNKRVEQPAGALALAKSETAELSSVHVHRESAAEELRTVRHELGVLRAEVARLVGENQELDMRGIRADEEFVGVRGELVKLRKELQMAEASSAELQSANTRAVEELEAALRLNVAMQDRVSEMEMDGIRANEEMTVLRAELQASKALSEELRVANVSPKNDLAAARRDGSAMEKSILEMEMESIRAGKESTAPSEELQTWRAEMEVLNDVNARCAKELVVSVNPSAARKKPDKNLVVDLKNEIVSAALREKMLQDSNIHLKCELIAARQECESTKENTKILHAESHVLAKELVAVKTELNSANNCIDTAQVEIKRLETKNGRLLEEIAMSGLKALRVGHDRLPSSSELEHEKVTLDLLKRNATLSEDLAAEKKKTQASYRSSMSKLALMGEKSRQLEVLSVEIRSVTEEKSKLQKQNSQLRGALKAYARAQGKAFAEAAEI
ncbi:hypothetical protein P167DRAFT_550016 [Morchella conica CCBAS932]|uniref:Uncharacterized protein n=1 Tax=Morchella conica CCBAS932 TaxID=1392247 RepID=A0A3N4K9A2_9PEZI|nr:hypothetical protein P167DRAFT_550016 [Morchella conica CCBAS932]